MLRETAQQLLRLLARWDRRLRLQASLLWVPRGMLAALIAGVGLAVLARLRPLLLPEQIAALSAGAVFLSIVVALAAIWLRQHDALDMARRFDDLFELRERISTALELAAGRIRSTNEEITARQLDDALTRARRIDLRAYLPLGIAGREVAALLALATALILLLAAENPQTAALTQQQNMQNAIQQQVTDLQNLRAELAQDQALDAQMRQEMLRELDQAVEQLSRQQLSQEEAYATLSDLADRMQEFARDLVQVDREVLEAARQAVEGAARQFEEQSPALAEAMRQGNLAEVAAAMSSLSEQLGEMEDAARQNLAEAMRAAAEELSQISPALAETLREAAEALEQGDTGAARQALDEAARQAQDMAEAGEAAMQAQAAGQRAIARAARQAQEAAQQVAQAGSSSQEAGQSGSSQRAAGQPEEGRPIRIISGQQAGQGGETARIGGQTASGQPPEDAGGQPTDGAAGQSGGQQGQAAGAGEGISSGEEGGFAASGEQIAQDNNPGEASLTDFEPVYAPQRIGAGEGQQVQISGSGQPGDQITGEGDFAEAPRGESRVGYDRVFSSYVNAANQAMERDYIPLGLRDVIRSYFISLAP